jgi:hypothetical protein
VDFEKLIPFLPFIFTGIVTALQWWEQRRKDRAEKRDALSSDYARTRDERDRLQKRVDTLEEKLDAAKAEHDKEIETLNAKHTADVDALKLEHVKNIDALTTRFDEEMAELKADHARQVESLTAQCREKDRMIEILAAERGASALNHKRPGDE